jgi:hypothetical protein
MVLMEVSAFSYGPSLRFSSPNSRLHSRGGEVEVDIKQNALFSTSIHPCGMKQKKKFLVYLKIQAGEMKGGNK